MKKFLVIALFALFLVPLYQVEAKDASCETISSGKITDSKGNVIQKGYDEFGDNRNEVKGV